VITKNDALAQMRSSTTELLALLDGVSHTEWKLRPAGKEWSIAETVEHVVLTNRGVLARLGRLFASPLADDAPRFDDAAISSDMFRTAGPAPPGLAEPEGRFATRAEGVAALEASRDALLAWARDADGDLRRHGLPHPVFGVFDGVQWILFAAAHTDNHVPQVRALRAACYADP
jgi:hypothetical protein